MKTKLNKLEKRGIRHRRVRAKVIGTTERPRLSVFKSNQNLYVQIIDDSQGKTLVGLSSVSIREKLTGLEKAKRLGELLGQKANEVGVKNVIFDRGGFIYHGRVKAIAEGARSQGLKI